VKRLYLNQLLALAVLLLLASALTFAQNTYSGGGEGYYGAATQSNTNIQSDHLKVGKEGHITLAQTTRIGGATLAPGDYEVRHRRSANGHFVEFTRVVDNTGEEGLSPSPLDWAVAADVPCIMQPLNAPVTRTSVEILRAHLNNLRIRGENVVHVFQPGPDPSAPQNRVEYGGPGM
jgi:hypothetical protein